MNRITLFVLFFFVDSFSMRIAPDDQVWSLIKTGSDIELYRKPSQSGYANIMVKTRFEVSQEKFIKLINNVDRYHEWIYRCEEARRLESADGKSIGYISVSDFPFPLEIEFWRWLLRNMST